MSALGQKQTSDGRALMSALPQKRTLLGDSRMSALCQKRTSAKASPIIAPCDADALHEMTRAGQCEASHALIYQFGALSSSPIVFPLTGLTRCTPPHARQFTAS
jgi:hypothetical protein